MSKTYCKALSRVGKKYICMYSGKEVDPLVMPCFDQWQKCPIFISKEGGEDQRGGSEVERTENGDNGQEIRSRAEIPELDFISNMPPRLLRDKELSAKVMELQHRLPKLLSQSRRVDRLAAEYKLALRSFRKEYTYIKQLIEEIMEIINKRLVQVEELESPISREATFEGSS